MMTGFFSLDFAVFRYKSVSHQFTLSLISPIPKYFEFCNIELLIIYLILKYSKSIFSFIFILSINN